MAAAELAERLEKIVSDCERAAPVYARKFDELRSLNSYSEGLRNEGIRLQDSIRTETAFRSNRKRQKEQIEQACNNSLTALNRARDCLFQVSLENYILAKKYGGIPMIYDFIGFNDKTPLIRKTHYSSQIVDLKARILEKRDQLRQLQENVYCLDDESCEGLPGVDYSSDPSITDQFCGILESSFCQPVSNHQVIATRSLGGTVSSMVNKLKKPLYTEITIPTVKFPIPKAVPTVHGEVPVIDFLSQTQQMQESINTEVQALTALCARRKDIVAHITNEYSKIPENCVVCGDLIITVQDRIREAQTMLKALARADTSDEKTIWAAEVEIASVMSGLITHLRRFSERLSKEQWINYPFEEVPEMEPRQVSVDVIASTQIEKLMVTIGELEQVLSQGNVCQKEILDQLNYHLDAFKQISEMSCEESVITLPEPEPDFDNDDPLWKEYLQMREEIFKHNSEQLAQIGEILSELPDGARYENMDMSETAPAASDPTEAAPFRLNPMSFELPPVVTRSNPYEESNKWLLERIKNKSPSAENMHPVKVEPIARAKTNRQLIESLAEELTENLSEENLPELEARRAELIEAIVSLEMAKEAVKRNVMEKVQRQRELAVQKAQLEAELEEARETHAKKKENLEKAKSVEKKLRYNVEVGLPQISESLLAKLASKESHLARLKEAKRQLEKIEKEKEEFEKMVAAYDTMDI